MEQVPRPHSHRVPTHIMAREAEVMEMLLEDFDRMRCVAELALLELSSMDTMVVKVAVLVSGLFMALWSSLYPGLSMGDRITLCTVGCFNFLLGVALFCLDAYLRWGFTQFLAETQYILHFLEVANDLPCPAPAHL
ncbi:hypothetical protein ACP4OV_025279 [Aristida adscensionis]